MQNVSDEYKRSMKSPLRGRGFLKATLRLKRNGEELLIEYNNDNILSSSYSNRMSPVCIELPQDDFSLKVDNQDRFFDIDNPDSAINYLKEGNELTVQYGYELPDGTVEWLPVKKMLLTDWKADNKTATFNAVDPLRLLTEPLPKEKDIASQIPEQPLSQMLQWLLNGSKVNLQFEPETSEDPVVKPDFPGETPKREAIQMLINANSYDASLINSNTLVVRPAQTSNIKTEVPTQFINADPLSGIPSEILEPKVMYASLAKNYTRVDGSFSIKPGNLGNRLNAGLISETNGNSSAIVWGSTPSIPAYKASGIYIKFSSDTLPSNYTIRTTSLNGTSGEYTGQITSDTMTILIAPDIYTNITFEFSAMQNEERFSVLTAHLINRENLEIDDMLSYPVAQTEELINTITVEWYDYEFVWENFVKKPVEGTTTGEKFKITYDASLYHKLRVHTGKSSAPYYITGESKNTYGDEILCTIGSYRVTKLTESAIEMFTLQPMGITLTIDGYRRETFRHEVTKQINPNGTKDIVWKNPMVTSERQAMKLLGILGNYYKDNVYYEYPTRGNPEFESGDIITQANDYFEDFEVQLVNHTVDFETSFKGKIKTKRIGGEK